MRVVGGQWSGRVLSAPRGDGTRPTSDRVREALFNILGDIEGARVLDVCAGTGAIGFEALSRGAAALVAIEHDRQAQRAIQDNAAALGVHVERSLPRPALGSGDSAPTQRVTMTLLTGDLRRALPGLEPPFHLVFCDPPWAQVPEIHGVVLAHALRLLAPGGQVILEHAARTPATEPPPGLVLGDTRRYGDTALSFYEPGQAAAAAATENPGAEP